MPGPYEPPPGDPGRMTAGATRLGEASGAVGTLATSFDRGAGLTALAVMRSDSAPRIDEMTAGLRGLRAELDRLRTSGELVADVVREVAGRQRRLEEVLAELAVEAGRREPAPGASADLEDAAHEARRAFATAEASAAAEIDRLSHRLVAPDRADLQGIDRVGLDLSTAGFTATRAWAGVNGAFEAVAEAEHRANQATSSYQVIGAIAGFYEGGETTVNALAHPVASCLALADLGTATARDPAGTAVLLWRGFRDPYVDDWRAGDKGRAVGRGLEYALELAVGARGATQISHRVVAKDVDQTIPVLVPDPFATVRSDAAVTARRIAAGHAYRKHVLRRGEFPQITSQDQFEVLIRRIITTGEVRVLRDGRVAYWRDGTIVVAHPSTRDGGTALVPKRGYSYFQDLDKDSE